MARSAQRAIKHIEAAGDDISDEIFTQLASLRKEIASIADSASKYSGNRFDDVQHNALALADDFRHQGEKVARQVGKQARIATKAAQDNPVPLVVALGAIALASIWIFSRD